MFLGLEEKCSAGELHEIFENDPNPQFQKKEYETARDYLENLNGDERRCDEHLNFKDQHYKVDGFYHQIHVTDTL